MFMLNNKPLGLDTAFTTEDGTQYPANWIRLASPEERAAIGITEVADPERYDDRFYWGVGNPKDIDMLKTNMVSQVKVTAGTLLAPTDWKVIRATETSLLLDSETLATRAAIRTASNDNETAINACVTVDELAALQLNWPE
jgi:hypothetical protein